MSLPLKNNPPYLHAGAPIIKGDPNSIMSADLFRLLNYLLQTSEGDVSQTFFKFFQPSQLQVTNAGLISTVPALNPVTNQALGASSLVGVVVRLTNTTGVDATATLYAVPASLQVGAANEFYPGLTVKANSFIDVNVPVLLVGDTLWGFSGTANAITISFMAGTLQG